MNKQYIKIAIITIILVLAISLIPPYLRCTNEVTEKVCYKYITSGGIFGGVSTVEVSCNNPHDFYRQEDISPRFCFSETEKQYD